MLLGDFYLILLARIKATVPEIKFVDWWNNQLENEDDEYPFNRPAVFIEFPPAEVITLGMRKQAWNQNFILHIVFDLITETSSTATQTIRERNIAKHTDILDKLHKNLENYQGVDQGSSFGSIMQQGSPVSHNYDAIIAHEMHFFVRLENRAAMRTYTKVTPAPDITTQKEE